MTIALTTGCEMTHPAAQWDRERLSPTMAWRIVSALLMVATLVCANRAYAACATNFGGQSLPTSQFTINADGTVNDGATGLDRVVTRFATKVQGSESAQLQGMTTAVLHSVWRYPATA